MNLRLGVAMQKDDETFQVFLVPGPDRLAEGVIKSIWIHNDGRGGDDSSTM